MTNDNEYFYLLLDEIQMLDSFVGTLNGFLSHSNFDIYVTGSNSQLLSSEIETKFRGRKSSIHLLPLSFSEFVTGANLSPESAWRKYIVTGGIPIIYQQDEEDREKYLLDLCYETYLKDIIGRKNIKDADNLSDLLGVLASCIGSGVSPSNLEKTFKLNKNIIMCDDTISNYINHFQDDNGNFCYEISGSESGKALYDEVQNTVNAVRKAGATKVIAVGHLNLVNV